ncbi:Cna B-type domain-containing protein [Firmicutes bacterium OM07-11]|nr:Cna B-type domain-containing protein [Firmicutes bacterium OM07-11]
MRGEGKRHLILKKILAYALVLIMILGIWTSVSNAAEQSEFNVEENTIEEAADITEEITTNTDSNLTEDKTISDTDRTEAEIEDVTTSDTTMKTDATTISDIAITTNTDTPQDAELDADTAKPSALVLSSDENTAPAHRKYIKYNGEDSYTLTLDVTGKYDSTLSKPKIDVVLIVDTSGSMDEPMGEKSRLEVLQDVVTEKGGLSDSIFNNDQIDARMTVVTYYGLEDYYWYNSPWDDATWVNGAWATTKSEVDQIVNGIRVNEEKSGTNCQAGLRTAKEALAKADSSARKIVIFLSDGLPTYRYNNDGYTIGNGNTDSYNYNANAAYNEAAAMKGLDQFYTIGFSNSADSTFLSTLAEKVNTTSSKKYYSAADADKLAEAFKQITGNLTEYTCRSVVLTDTLSDYAELENAEHLNPTVKATASDGSEVDLSGVDIQTTYNEETRTVTATFPTDYKLQKDVTYAVSFNVKPTAKAYDEYAANEDSYGGVVGSMNSDAWDNDTSSGKAGFYTNAGATLTYIYGTGEAQAETVDYVEKPVLQVNSLTILVNKEWKNTAKSEQVPVKVELYQDGKLAPYKTLTLNADNQWRADFQHVAKHHQYQIKEQTLEGFVSAVSGDSTSGFTVTNTKLPSLSISKKVTGEMGDITKKFPFRIILKDASGNPINGTYSYRGFILDDVKNVTAPKDGTLTFEQGVAEIWLSHGQGIELQHLSLGTSYNITEKINDAEGYRVSFNGIHKKSVDGILNEDVRINVTNEKENIPLTNVATFGTNMIPGILLATVALFVLAAISKLFYGKKDKKQDK